MHIPIGIKGNPLTKTFSALPEEHIMHTFALILYILGFFQMAIASLWFIIEAYHARIYFYNKKSLKIAIEWLHISKISAPPKQSAQIVNFTSLATEWHNKRTRAFDCQQFLPYGLEISKLLEESSWLRFPSYFGLSLLKHRYLHLFVPCICMNSKL